MEESNLVNSRTKTTGDIAIDGLFAGLIAGVVMVLVLVLSGLFVGDTPSGVLARFSTGQTPSPMAGALVHLAVSGVYGVGFSMLANLLPQKWLQKVPGWLLGGLYGILLLAVAVGVLLPGLRSPLLSLPLAALAAGHLVYGLILGWQVVARR